MTMYLNFVRSLSGSLFAVVGDLHVLSLLYCVLFNPKTPSYLKEKFKFLGVQSELRSSRALTLSMPFHKTKFYKHSFTVKATELWNALPLNIRHSKSLGIFKNTVKAHYLAQ
ncbi:jg8060 [Pararge aegeria aegeria]|uniref:Jg8060 protein n=1 Tax=Pararge aegeria aegeria TaxID=348720 RepID=A0A8S4QHY3_9NEOP|nr:jg8060 [Pararge aegeria aegeria]